MKQKITALVQQDFVRHNTIFFVGSLGVAAFSYLYYPVIGRLVSVSSFGEIQAWISLFMEFGIILTAFGYVITNVVRNHQDKSTKDVLLLELERLAFIISLSVFFCLCVAGVFLKTSFQFTSALPFVGLGGLIILNVPATFRTYYLQGEKKLKEVAISGIIFAVGKLIISAGLVILGWKLFGVIDGYIIAQLLTLYYVVAKTRGKIPPLKTSLSLRLQALKFRTERQVLKREMRYGLFILVLLSIVTILYTSDAIIVRRFFSPEQSGLYSGISSVARIVYFVTASVSGVLIASVKMHTDRAENRQILRKSFLLVLAIGGIALLSFTVLPKFAIVVLIGRKYQQYANLLPLLSVSMLSCALNNLLFSYQIALRKFATLVSAVIGIVLLVLLVLYNHATLFRIVCDYALSNGMVLAMTIIQIITERREYVEN